MVPNDLWKLVYSQRPPNVLQLEARHGPGEVSGGSAFVFADGLIATAAHNVVKGDIMIWDPNGDEILVPPESITFHSRWDENSLADVAILSVPGLKAPIHLDLRKQPVQIGEEIAAFGFPILWGHEPPLAIKAGIVEAAPRSYDGKDRSMIVSCGISGGMSGGPVVDRFGALVGIVMQQSIHQPNPNLPAEVELHILPVYYLFELLDSQS
jgi:S1-C subfamily serine protease